MACTKGTAWRDKHIHSLMDARAADNNTSCYAKLQKQQVIAQQSSHGRAANWIRGKTNKHAVVKISTIDNHRQEIDITNYHSMVQTISASNLKGQLRTSGTSLFHNIRYLADTTAADRY